MPTKRRRHTITEVGGVEAALDRLRAQLGEPDLRELVVLGAERKLALEAERATDSQRRAALRERLIARSTGAAGVDLDAATEVRARGFSRDLDA